MMFWDGGWGPAGWIFMSLMMVGFWALVIAAVVFAVRAMGSDRDRARADDQLAARRILNERLARGELTEEEYTRRRQLLDSR